MATIPIIQLLRNNNIYSTRADARSALELYKKDVPDGGLILATYSSDNAVKTLLGIVRNSGSENAQITIMDVEGAAENVQDAIDALSAYTNTKLTEEKNAREAADTTLQNNIDALSLSTDTKINAEVTRATGKEAELATAIDNEKKRAEAKESDLNAKIQALDGSLGDTVSTTVASGEYSSTDKAIYLKNASGETLSTINATDFIKDGMVTSVSVVGENLVITFNTDAGHEDINIPISAIFNANNYYTKSEVDEAIANVDVTEQLQNYYTKSEVDEKDAAINSTIEAYGQVTSQALNDLGTRMDDYGQTTSQALNDLATRLDQEATSRESGDTTLQNNINALSGDTKTKIDAEAQARTSGDTTLQGNIDTLSSSTDTKIASETTARQEADTTLQTNIDNVNTALIAHTENTVVHVTQEDKDKWNRPTDLSNYYTKTEVDTAIANVDVTEQLQNYYTKTEVDEKDAAINSTIESYGQVTSQALNDLGTRMDDYGQVTSQSLNDLSTKFGDYYTKTEVDSKDTTLQTALDALEARIAELETKFLNMENNGLQAGEY